KERKLRQVAAHLLLGLRMIEVPHFVDDDAVRSEIAQGLIVVADADVVAVRDRAGERLQAAGEGLEQRRLARAVRPDDGVALAAADGHSQHVDYWVIIAGDEAVGGQRDGTRAR